MFPLRLSWEFLMVYLHEKAAQTTAGKSSHRDSPARLGTRLAFPLLSAGTKHHPGPNVFLSCHLGKLTFRMFNFCPQIIFPDFHQKGKGDHISFHFSLLSIPPMRPEIRSAPSPEKHRESCHDCRWLPEIRTSGDLCSSWEIIFLDSFRKEGI